METLLKDTRYAIRSLLKRPGVALMAVITLVVNGEGRSVAGLRYE